jgi:hypothetical protein
MALSAALMFPPVNDSAAAAVRFDRDSASAI